MSGRKLSGSGSRLTPSHRWTEDQKRCLLLLLDNFQLLPDQTTLVFNNIFRSEIDATKFPDGLPIKSIKAQYREAERGNNGSWLRITNPESWEVERKKRDELAARIRLHLESSDGDASGLQQFEAASPFPVATLCRKRKLDEAADGSRDVQLDPDTFETASTRHAQVVLIPRVEVEDRLAYLIIDETEEEDFTPRTPVKQMRTSLLSPPSTIRHVRSSGPALDVTLKVHAEIEKGYSPPSEDQAHPPLGGLFYRFWDASDSQGHNAADGFVAKRYVRSNAVPIRAYAPPAKHLDPTDLWNHLNEEHETTPFVSVSDSLTWSLSKLLKLVKKGKWKDAKDAKLSIIDGTKLSRGSVFHAAGFYRQLQKIRCFTNGAHRGVSSHEYLIWRDIPASAMIKTISVKEILTATAKSAEMARLLRFEVLSAPGGYQTVIRPRLQQGNVHVTANTAASIAEVAQLLGLRHDSAFEHHRHLVHDLASSYKMVINYNTTEEWRTIASHYAHAFVRQSASPVSATTQSLLKLAFLEGIRLGASYDFKLSRLDAKILQTVQKKARLIGLEDPAKVIAGEADAVKVHVGVEQRRQWRVFEMRPSRMLLEEGEGDLDVEGQSVFEMDDEGLVI